MDPFGWTGWQQVIPSRRPQPTTKSDNDTPRHAAMTWAQRLKRVFNIDIQTCERCGGAMKIVSCIEDPVVIGKILDHLARRDDSGQTKTHPARALPQHITPQRV